MKKKDDLPRVPGSKGDPRGHDPILGQASAVDELRVALRGGRVPQAWIFHGASGVGKTSTAIRFARLLLEPEPTPAEIEDFAPPLDSEAAQLIDAGTHPDLKVIRKELAADSDSTRLRASKQSNIPIGVLREHMLGGEVDGKQYEAVHARTPYKGVRRVFIIEEAELLDQVGQNALLKTLEEPASRVVIILVTTREERLLPTVRSRCRRVGFRGLDEDAMNAWLDGRPAAVDGASREWLLAFADGSPGRLEMAESSGMLHWSTTVAPGMARLEAGEWPANFADTLHELVDEYAKSVVKADKRASKEAANKAGLAHLAAVLATRLRLGLDASATAGDDEAVERIARAIERIADAEFQIGRNVNMKFVLAELVAGMADDFGVGAMAGAS
ncbi:MAG: AAA family ATPase [Planctomycetia bacterium]|nr:AAA family ATPase [Planctomycetia bacterium]